MPFRFQDILVALKFGIQGLICNFFSGKHPFFCYIFIVILLVTDLIVTTLKNLYADVNPLCSLKLIRLGNSLFW